MSNTIQDIFIDHYEEIVYTMHPRPVEIENIERMINCGDPSFGGAMYGCPKCGAMKFVPFRCHSRFCPSCGTMYARKRAEAMAGKLINCKTPSLRVHHSRGTAPFFLEDRSLLDCLFDA